jgi:hypothetical protein
MKKKFSLMLISTIVAMSANAQHREGDFSIQPRVGLTLSTFTNDDDAKMKPALTYGVEGEYYFVEQFSVAAGVLFTNQGAKYSEDNSTINNYYCAVPITANYYVLPGLALKVGLQPALRVKTNMKIDGKKYDMDKVIDFLFEDTDAKMNKFDLSIPVGLSYEYSGITLDARYNFGVTKIFSGIDESMRNSMFVVTLGYKL